MSAISPRIIAEVAYDSVKIDVKNGTVATWTHHAVGKLLACAAITQDYEIQGMANEAFFLAGEYARRHNLEW